MRFQSFIQRAGLAGCASVGLLTVGACGSDPVAPEPEDIYIEVHVTGGLAAVDFSYAVDGAALEARGITCSSVCDFEPGEVLVHLTPAQVVYFADLLVDAGIWSHDGTDFGEQCCDQFHYTIEYRDGERESSVRGSAGSLPGALAAAVAQLDLLVQGIDPGDRCR